MAFRIHTPRLWGALAGVLVLFTLALAAGGPMAPTAHAGTACGKYGDVNPTKLRLDQARRSIRCLLNRQRARRGIPRLESDRKLTRASQNHNEYMQQTDCFAHTCRGERDLSGRLGLVGYLVGGLTRWAAGENIAWGGQDRGSPKAIVRAWMNSPGHRANILNSTFRDLGVGFSKGSPYSRRDDAGTYTTDFGLRIG